MSESDRRIDGAGRPAQLLRMGARLRRRLRQSATNAVELARLGRLGEAHQTPFEIVERDRVFRLRRYPVDRDAPERLAAPVVLVPPLMLQAEVYDMSPERSVVATLARAGIEAFVVDFGAPEREEGGLRRTLDDHVRAVSRAVDRVSALSGRPVHLAGYSQGGMFAYQATALRRSEGVASVVTFGSPVDIHRNSRLDRGLTALALRAARPFVTRQLERIEALPGELTSAGFKMLTPRKEIEQLVEFVKKLHDRKALERREARRRFLGGEGFVAWPAPDLRAFFEEFVVHNRMLSGGFVIDGRTVTLADITCPVLCFWGSRDDLARPAAVRAIRRAAPEAEIYEVGLDAGHFGLVVGSGAMNETWPTVVDWLRFREGRGGRPARLVGPEGVVRPAAAPGPSPGIDDEPAEAAFDVEVDFDFLLGAAGALGRVLRRVGLWVQDAAEGARGLRFQVPRLRALEALGQSSRWSLGLALAEQAAALPARTFFLWRGRAVTYAEADARVDRVVRGLIRAGIRPGDKVALAMRPRPSLLSAAAALSRLGAVAVVVSPRLRGEALASALDRAGIARAVADPESAAETRAETGREILVLGGGGEPRALGEGLVDMEAIDPDAVELPAWYAPNPGRAADLALVFATPGGGAEARLAPVTGHRLALSALGAAAACTLTPDDTVYCCLPLHHPAGLMVAASGALVGGARLALAERFDPEDPAGFWREVRRYGASVVFYAGEMARSLAMAPPTLHDKDHPVRLFAGSGMRADLWERMVERFGVGVLEFYASTSRNLVLANASGEKVGALGRPLPGGAEVALVRFDPQKGEPLRGGDGRAIAAAASEPGLALGRLGGDGGALSAAPAGAGERILTGVFSPGDRWFTSGDVLRRDRDGDYFYVDRLTNMVEAPGGLVSCRAVEDALYRSPDVALASAYDDEGLAADVVARRPLDAGRLGAALGELAPHERPRRIRQVRAIPLSEGFQPIKTDGRGAGPAEVARAFRYVPETGAYVEEARAPVFLGALPSLDPSRPLGR